VAAHCYGCTAGQGSSCGGALEPEALVGAGAQTEAAAQAPVGLASSLVGVAS
jgi:hypothetical protein